MATSNTISNQLALQVPSILTCVNHPTIVGDYKCDRCQKIICLQCYNKWGVNSGFCIQCFTALQQGCCIIS